MATTLLRSDLIMSQTVCDEKLNGIERYIGLFAYEYIAELTLLRAVNPAHCYLSVIALVALLLKRYAYVII